MSRRLPGWRKNDCLNRFETFCAQPEVAGDFFIWIPHNPLKSPNSAKGIQGSPSNGGQDPTHTQTWGKSLANSRRGHRLRTTGNAARLSLYKRQSCSYLAPAIVLIATLSTIAHTDNNATLKPARRSPIEAGDTPLDMARRAAIPLLAPRSAAAGGRRSETRQEFSPRSHSGQAGGLAAEEAAARSRSSWRRSPWSSWRRPSSPWSRAADGLLKPGWKPPPGRRAVDPGSYRGKTQARVQGGHSALGRAMGSRRLQSRRRPSEGLAGHMAKRGKRDSPARVKVRKRRDAEGERSPRARARRKGANEGDGRTATVMSSDESQELTMDPVGSSISGARLWRCPRLRAV